LHSSFETTAYSSITPDFPDFPKSIFDECRARLTNALPDEAANRWQRSVISSSKSLILEYVRIHETVSKQQGLDRKKFEKGP
jgi:hypothetical protein